VTLRMRAFRALTQGDGVELGANGAPVAFRIWKSGENPTDHGMTVLTPESLAMLLAEQAKRGNRYSIDFDHASLDVKAPPEARRAAGWFQLGTRDGGDLWAESVEWTDVALSGLTKTPPEFRYFSPAYDQQKDGTVVSLINLALTNNPATWHVTALANSKGNPMTIKECLAALFGSDEEKKKAAYAALATMAEGDDDDGKVAKAALATAAAMGDEPSKEEPAKETETEEPAKDEPKKEEASKASRVAASATALAALGEQDRRIAELETYKQEQDRARILATRPDLTASQLKVLAAEPVASLPKLLALIPAPKTDPAAAQQVTATRGATQGASGQDYGHMRASRLPPKERDELREKMGMPTQVKGVHWSDEHPGELVFPLMSPQQSRQILASRAKAQAEELTRGGTR
jgi:phage I-like protein